MSISTAEGVFPESVGVGADAAAVLEFTSDTNSVRRNNELIYVTSKDSYIWATVSALIARSFVQKTVNERIDDITIVTAIYSTVLEYQKIILLHTSGLPHFYIESYNNKKFMYVHSSVKLASYDCVDLIKIFLRKLGITRFDDSFDDPSVIEELNDSIRVGYGELRQLGLVSDPIIETAIGITVLSITPFSFVRRTKKGRLVYQKIQAGLWKYEQLRGLNGDMKVSLTFETARIAKAIKAGLTAAYHQATKGEGDEPDETPEDIT